MPDLQAIIDLLQPTKIIGSTDKKIRQPIQLDAGNQRDDVIMWAGTAFYEVLSRLNRGTVICQKIDPEHLQTDVTYLLVENPRRSFSQMLSHFFVPQATIGVASTAIIAENVQLGSSVSIGDFVVIESDCILGDRVTIDHHTVLKRGTIVGSDVKIGANCVFGGRGFGYERDEQGDYQPIPHIGNVQIGNGVEIGSNTTIDRAVMGSTLIADNVKLDNNVQIGHGVQIGRNTLVIANSVIGGSSQIGQNVWVSPGVSITNKVTVGDDSLIGVGTVVIKNVDSKVVVFGNPARILNKVE